MLVKLGVNKLINYRFPLLFAANTKDASNANLKLEETNRETQATNKRNWDFKR